MVGDARKRGGDSPEGVGIGSPMDVHIQNSLSDAAMRQLDPARQLSDAIALRLKQAGAILPPDPTKSRDFSLESVFRQHLIDRLAGHSTPEISSLFKNKRIAEDTEKRGDNHSEKSTLLEEFCTIGIFVI